MFKNIAELVSQAESRDIAISEMMIQTEIETSGHSRDTILSDMTKRVTVMRQAIAQGIIGVQSHSGLSGGDARKMADYLASRQPLTGSLTSLAVRNAIATNEVNAAMGIVCATPTAGSAGVLPAVLLAAQEIYELSDETVLPVFFTAGAIGFVIANNAFISGAAGGCQAEIGSASAMAAAALTELLGGTPRQAAHAMTLALKNMLGLTCDPLAGRVEVPCIKRNAAGASNAILAADLALAGIESRVPWDEVIGAMYQIGLSMPISLRETALGGLAATPSGKAWRAKLWN